MRSRFRSLRFSLAIASLTLATACAGSSSSGTATVPGLADAASSTNDGTSSDDAATDNTTPDGEAQGDTESDGTSEGDTPEGDTPEGDTADDSSTDDIAEPAPPVTGACRYANPFSQGAECKEYGLEYWTVAAATTDCAAVLPGTAGTFEAGGHCGFDAELGRCVVGGDTPYVLTSAGSDASQCALAQTGCQVFAKGTFEIGATCEGELDPGQPGGGDPIDGVFRQPYLDCREPIASEPAGMSDGGKVCTWALISGCTEPGRKYADYASCDDVRTQRPYYPIQAEFEPAKADDPRLADKAYMDNVAWAKEQVEACACVCCHSTKLAPSGPSLWYIEAGPIWTDSIRPAGLAMLSGLADSTYLGAFPPKENNGFDRTILGMPTTDPERMADFLLGEWQRRGFTEEQGKAYPSFGGPLVSQASYVPTPCEGGEGVMADGKVVWTGGPARYVYVMDAGSKNPGVPPNLDLPVGTRWLVDVPSNAQAMTSPLTFGQVSGVQRQRVPESGAPALESGKTYTIYALLDIGVPVTRCTFTAP